MKKILLSLFFSFIALTWGSQARAGLNICNDSSLQIAVALGRNDDSNWHSRGWVILDPKECQQNVLDNDLSDGNFWYYAKSKVTAQPTPGLGELRGNFSTVTA